MVGRPDFPRDVDGRNDLKGSSVGTPGLTALDEEREASLADEGGASGAVVETQDEDELNRITSDLPVGHLQPIEGGRPRRGRRMAMIAGAAAGVLVALALRRRRARGRGRP
jgi:hypothetical protein